jgi:hypothetical protein
MVDHAGAVEQPVDPPLEGRPALALNENFSPRELAYGSEPCGIW